MNEPIYFDIAFYRKETPEREFVIVGWMHVHIENKHSNYYSSFNKDVQLEIINTAINDSCFECTIQDFLKSLISWCKTDAQKAWAKYWVDEYIKWNQQQ